MYNASLRFLITLLFANVALEAMADVAIHANYPGANIIVERQEAETVYLKQDLRDTKGWWFYWNFEATGSSGETVTFCFTDGNVIGTRGPALSYDAGVTWAWLGPDSTRVEGKQVSFTYVFSEAHPTVRFAFAPPYQQADLKRWLEAHQSDLHLRTDTLCESEQGRDVPRLHLGQLTGEPRYRILLTARHHSCESMASFVLEGLMEAMLDDSDDARWFRMHGEALVIPFVDLDGVEDGDQGKNRIPRDHGRDYQGESLYNSTRALRNFVPGWSDGLLRFTLDIHCPHIRGPGNERVYQVGHAEPTIWREQQRFAQILATQPDLPLPYAATNDMPYGEAWNKASNYTAGAGVFHWCGNLDGVGYASAIEVPYANAGDTTVTPDLARAFGAALLPAIRTWLETLQPALP